MREEGRVGERWGWRRQEREEQGSRDEEKAGNLEEEVGRAEAQRRGRGQGWEQRSQGRKEVGWLRLLPWLLLPAFPPFSSPLISFTSLN